MRAVRTAVALAVLGAAVAPIPIGHSNVLAALGIGLFAAAIGRAVFRG